MEPASFFLLSKGIAVQWTAYFFVVQATSLFSFHFIMIATLFRWFSSPVDKPTVYGFLFLQVAGVFSSSMDFPGWTWFFYTSPWAIPVLHFWEGNNRYRIRSSTCLLSIWLFTKLPACAGLPFMVLTGLSFSGVSRFNGEANGSSWSDICKWSHRDLATACLILKTLCETNASPGQPWLFNDCIYALNKLQLWFKIKKFGSSI